MSDQKPIRKNALGRGLGALLEDSPVKHKSQDILPEVAKTGIFEIPLDEIQGKVADIKAMKQPIILCCASGNRSGQATYFLQAQGIDCENGGSWLDVNYQLSK